MKKLNSSRSVLLEKAIMDYNQLKIMIDEEINSLSWENNIVDQACFYAVKKGKRLRPVLLLAFTDLFNGSLKEAMPYAVALEMIHNYSLIHDDLPSMDNDLYRRGELTVHGKYGEDIAVLAGDNLLNKAYEILFDDILHSENPEYKIKAGECISRLSGMKGMIGGQVIDVLGSSASSEDILKMYDMKTSALIKGACLSGTYLSEKLEYLDFAESYGSNLGLLFQLTDDILDMEQDKEAEKTTLLSYETKDQLIKRLQDLESEMKSNLKGIDYNTEVLEEIYLKMLYREV